MRKKLPVLLLLLLVGSSSILSQSNAGDSLNRLLAAHPQEDTVKVNLINQLIVQWRRTKPKVVDSLVNVSITISDRLNYTKGKGNALAVKAVRYYDLSDSLRQQKHLMTRKKLLESANDVHEEPMF